MGVSPEITGPKVNLETRGAGQHSEACARTMKSPGAVSAAGTIVFAFFLAISLYVYTLVQLLPPGNAWLASLIPFRGYYGDVRPIDGISYTQLLELSGALSFFGLFMRSYGRNPSSTLRPRITQSLAAPLKFFGALVGSIAYTETHLLWGELWYGIKFLNTDPQGFPWGSERVASNTCFIASNGDNCWFLNYDELFLISLVAVVVGLIISRRTSRARNAGPAGQIGPSVPEPVQFRTERNSGTSHRRPKSSGSPGPEG